MPHIASYTATRMLSYIIITIVGVSVITMGDSIARYFGIMALLTLGACLVMEARRFTLKKTRPELDDDDNMPGQEYLLINVGMTCMIGLMAFVLVSKAIL